MSSVVQGWDRHRGSALSEEKASWDTTWIHPKTMPVTVTFRDRSFLVDIEGEMSWPEAWVWMPGHHFHESSDLTVTCSVPKSCLSFAGILFLLATTGFRIQRNASMTGDTSSCINPRTLGLFWEMARCCIQRKSSFFALHTGAERTFGGHCVRHSGRSRCQAISEFTCMTGSSVCGQNISSKTTTPTKNTSNNTNICFGS